MNDDADTKTHYSFEADGLGGRVAYEFDVADGATWSEVARRFQDFLSAVYGYQVNLRKVNPDA